MRRLILLLCLCVAGAVQAQSSVEEIVRQIEQSNRELRARDKLAESQKLETKTGNYPSNPTVEYIHQWGNQAQMGKSAELEVKQEFDFPTVYSQRSQVAQLRRLRYDADYALFRLETLLRAKEVCIELIYLHRMKDFLDDRLANARKLSDVYAQRFAAGDANVLDVNKIELELINAQTEVSLNDLEIAAKLTELANLNGGEPIPFVLRDYPASKPLGDFETLYSEAVEKCPILQGCKSEQATAEKEVALSKAQALPKFALGYKGDYAFGQNFNGVLAGVSIPMFEHKNTIKRAKAQARFTEMQLENAQRSLRAELQKLYDQAKTLGASVQRVNDIMVRFGNYESLNKALALGEISITDYFFELIPRYESYRTLLGLERDYYLAMARLCRFDL